MDCPCTTCYQILKGTASLTAHNRRFHPNADEEQIKCSVCDKPFARPHDLKRHTSKHHSFPCESTNKFKEVEENKRSQEENQISQPCLNIELNNEDENYEEMENEDIDVNTTIQRDAKSTEGSGNSDTCVDSNSASHSECKDTFNKLRESLDSHTSFILKNADDILELINMQNRQKDQIKKIKEDQIKKINEFIDMIYYAKYV